MYRQRRHPSKLAQFILAAQLVIFAVANLVLLALSLAAMAKIKRIKNILYPDWAIYNYTAAAAGVASLVLVASLITTVARHRRASGPGPFLTPSYVRRCTLFTTVLHALALVLIFHEAYVWAQLSPIYEIPGSLLAVGRTATHRVGGMVFSLTGSIILTGVLFTGLSVAFEDPGVREYPKKELTTRSPSMLQVPSMVQEL
ncbi:unnamed protein product [Clonostachys byssicola]|uniref:Uncharacterized protein n=1 Tax=Clonostachys byssicola TaxID=160290 RepID=A0A9N9UTP5_9HYPO|nr:unnamed protein product [Clonostachys byssicola]